MQSLKGKIALIAGASSGIGYATAKLFAAEGASVVVGARRKSKLDAVVSEITEAGGKAFALAGDVTDEGYARALTQAAIDQFGGLDIAFNNAAMLGEMGITTEVNTESWRKTIDTNLTSAFLASKYQIPAMIERGGGSLIFTSSFVGYTAVFPGIAAYAASKAGVIALAQTLAIEFARQNVRVNAILPGGTETEMYREMNDTQEARDFIVSLYPGRRLARPEEIARSVLYLASDASSFTTGSALLVDGGVSVNRT